LEERETAYVVIKRDAGADSIAVALNRAADLRATRIVAKRGYRVIATDTLRWASVRGVTPDVG
jgi:hypothetical protein